MLECSWSVLHSDYLHCIFVSQFRPSFHGCGVAGEPGCPYFSETSYVSIKRKMRADSWLCPMHTVLVGFCYILVGLCYSFFDFFLRTISAVIKGNIENITFSKLVLSGVRRGFAFWGVWLPSLAPKGSEVSIITLN